MGLPETRSGFGDPEGEEDVVCCGDLIRSLSFKMTTCTCSNARVFVSFFERRYNWQQKAHHTTFSIKEHKTDFFFVFVYHTICSHASSVLVCECVLSLFVHFRIWSSYFQSCPFVQFVLQYHRAKSLACTMGRRPSLLV